VATTKGKKASAAYTHADQALLRPDVGTQAQFKKKKPPKTYRYDSSLSPALNWDGQNPARELGEWLIVQIEEASTLEPPHRFPQSRSFDGVEVSGLHDAIERLRALGRPFLDWAGKAERLSFDAATLPLFVHERLSTKAILETLGGHERDRQTELQLFADPQLPLHQQLEAYEHRGGWVNRMIMGDALTVMNSMLEYEGLGGEVQMIYLDPPYGVKFGSNFQPFVRKRDVTNNKDADMTREPEMVKAYRDTWELGLHSYLAYLRDRLLIARDLLAARRSIFVQINDSNLHHVRELLDEVFGPDNFSAIITYAKTTSTTGDDLSVVNDYIIWYFRDRSRNPKVSMLYKLKRPGEAGGSGYNRVRLEDGSFAPLSHFDGDLPDGARVCTIDNLTSSRPPGDFTVDFDGKPWKPPKGYWKTGEAGMQRLIKADRIYAGRTTLGYIRYLDDFPFFELNNIWTDTVGQNQFGPDGKIYAVQTANIAVQRCMLMATDPGDLVLDPTCGSGTTAYVAEQWGRRWITIDTSRVPLALTRQRLLTATYPYYELRDPARGPAGGFRYEQRQDKSGREVGGVVAHVTLDSIANEEPAPEEVLVDRPEADKSVTRVTGPFAFEAMIPTPGDLDENGDDSAAPEDASYLDRMLEALRHNPLLQLGGGRTISLSNVRPPSQALTIMAEAAMAPDDTPLAIVFGPENGAVTEKLIYESAREAHMAHYDQLLVIGFAIEPEARAFVEKVEAQVGTPTTYVQATPDLVMGDLLKTMRSSQLFSVSGLPDIVVRKLQPASRGEPQLYEVELRGLDTFDPATFETTHRGGADVPAWLLDTAWNGLAFHVSQAFFPRTSAWDNLRKALKADLEDTVWDHLSGTVSAPFTAGDPPEIAVKVIDDRGNELLVFKSLDEAE